MRNLPEQKQLTMSRLDYLTIGIIAIIVLAVLYLVYKMTNLFQSDALRTPAPTEQAAEPPTYDYYDEPYDSLVADTLFAEDEMGYDESGDAYTDANAEDPHVADADAPEYAYEDEHGHMDAEAAGDYFVLAGTFAIRENADRMVAQLHRMGYTDARVGVFNAGRFAAAIICCYTTPQAARETAAQLMAEGIEAVAYRKRGR